MEEQIQDINDVICTLLSERRRLELEAAGISPELLDAELYTTLHKTKQQLYYRNSVIEKKKAIILENENKIKELEDEILQLKQKAGLLARPLITSNNSSVPRIQ